MEKHELLESISNLVNTQASEFSETIAKIDSAIEKSDYELSKNLLKAISKKIYCFLMNLEDI